MSEQDIESKGEIRRSGLSTGVMSHEDVYELGLSLLNTFKLSRIPKDIEEAIEYLSHALQLTPDGHPALPDRYAALGVSYTDRYRRLGELDDLKNSIEYKSHALALTPNGHPDLPFRHADQGGSYTDRYRRLGQLDDLEKAIEHNSCAISLTPRGHPSMSNRHTGLGVSYVDRYRRLGQLIDLENAIEHFTRALALTPVGHLNLPRRHANLGGCYDDRYRHLGQLDDLESSIEHISHALALTPDGHPDISSWHAGLGVSYTGRFERLGQVDDLDKSIKHLTQALELTPNSHPDLSDRHAGLGAAYTDRFQRLGQLVDLEKSIEHRSRALALTPDGHPDLSDWHAGLGVSYSDRYQHLGQLHDLEQAIEHNSRTILLASTSAHRRLFLLDTYIDFAGAPRDKFQYALHWANLATKHTSLNPIEAFHTTIDLLPQFIWLGTTTHQRYQDLSAIENLAISAASAAILHSDHKLAFEWLEHARCVVWNQTLMLRSPVDKLQSFHPDLAIRFQAVAKQLHDSGTVSSASHTRCSEPFALEQVGKQRRRLAMEYEHILAEARKLPGFEDFLRPTKADQIVRAARYGPIVVINCHKDHCDALLLLPGQENIRHLPLPNFTHNKAKTARLELEASLRRKGLRERGVRVKPQLGQKDGIASGLSTLWHDVVSPVLDFLGYLNNIPGGNLPHITWCPTGALSFLPLHAAGDYDQPGARVFDYVVSSYAPTLTALLASTPSSLSCASQVLAIGQEHTPGRSPLPGTTKELANLEAHTQAKTGYTHLRGNQATVANVIDAMEKHDWVHLACHAHQNVSDPTKSGFFLHDGTLDLATINRRSFKNKGLAFLSACQTATGDERLPDEAIHLASGMLMAGYPSVIATMWSVIDSDAPFVADKVYGQLMKDGKVGNGEAGKALHDAVGALREKVGEKEFARWVPYIHVGS